LGTAADYATWLSNAGLEVGNICDLTPRITRTWEICRRRVERTGVTKLARVFGRDAVNFIDNFDLILKAYQSGAMKYASIVANKP